jgi:uncharacterized phiE125 gp8 family phage protein
MSVLDLVRTVDPAPLVTLDQAKAHLNVLHDDDNDKIEDLVTAAVDLLDGYGGMTGKALVEQTWAWHLPAFPTCRRLALPVMPLISVESIGYLDADGAAQTVDDVDALVTVRDGLLADITLKAGAAWPATACDPRAVTITFKAGHGAPAAVPRKVYQAVLLLLAHWYANPSAVNVGNITTALPFAVERLLGPFRRRRI